MFCPTFYESPKTPSQLVNPLVILSPTTCLFAKSYRFSLTTTSISMSDPVYSQISPPNRAVKTRNVNHKKGEQFCTYLCTQTWAAITPGAVSHWTTWSGIDSTGNPLPRIGVWGMVKPWGLVSRPLKYFEIWDAVHAYPDEDDEEGLRLNVWIGGWSCCEVQIWGNRQHKLHASLWQMFKGWNYRKQWWKPWLVRFYTGLYYPVIIQLYRDYFIRHEIRIPSWTNQDFMECHVWTLITAQMNTEHDMYCCYSVRSNPTKKTHRWFNTAAPVKLNARAP